MAETTTTAPMIRRQLDDGICLLTFDRPESGANIFDAATLRDLSEQLDWIESEQSLRGLIITSAKKSIFIAGADLKTLLRQAQTGELRAFIAEGQRIFNRIAELKIPSCAAIHGACAGGGYEITLACDWRVASNEPATRIGLPETTLGLIPAWGGATRLPRLIGTNKASEVILKGKLYTAAEAKELGLIDEVVPRDKLLDAARSRLHAAERSSPYPLPEGEADGKAAGEGKSAVRATGNLAPARAQDVIATSLRSSVADSLAAELDGIVELGKTDATQNLIRNFFLADKYRKNSAKAPAEKIAHAAVIGAGIMGSGIAQWLSSRGVSVTLRDVAAEQLNRGVSLIEKTYADAVKRGIMPEEKAKQGRSRIVASTDPGAMRDVQVVIEAASEKIEIKKQIFRDLASKAPHALMLATNTSALPISDLAAETNAPERVIGLHFFNPVSRMKLVEIVVGEQTSDETIQRGLAFVRQIGKLPVTVRDSPGFLVNRVLFPYLLDAAELFENSVSASEIDDGLLKWGMPMGPLRLIDEIGVDITVDIAQTLERAYGTRDGTPKILREMLAAGMLGRKSGGGFYKFEGRTQTKNDSLDQWKTTAGEKFEAEGITNRLVFLMVNEAARCLEGNVVATPEDVDYGMILGTGFPAFRGGPLRFAESFGIKKLVTEMDGIHSRAGEKFAPCDLLRKHAQEGTKFYE